MPKLSILIPTIESRRNYLAKLDYKLKWEINLFKLEGQVEILIEYGAGTIGEKRNKLLQRATGDYIAFIDDDDDISDDYLHYLIEGIKTNPTHCSLIGLYIENGIYKKPFIHSNKYKHAFADSQFYYRAPLHINCIKRSLCLDFKFDHKNFGEDGVWMEHLVKSGRLNNEYWIPQVLYFYNKKAL